MGIWGIEDCGSLLPPRVVTFIYKSDHNVGKWRCNLKIQLKHYCIQSNFNKIIIEFYQLKK